MPQRGGGFAVHSWLVPFQILRPRSYRAGVELCRLGSQRKLRPSLNLWRVQFGDASVLLDSGPSCPRGPGGPGARHQCPGAGWQALASGELRERRQSMKRRQNRPPVDVPGHPPTTCGGSPNVGYRIWKFSSGKRAAVWYPTLIAESNFQYANGLSTAMAQAAPLANCGAYPLVVFSHGFGGCGIQSVFFTQELARHGYIVVALDHKDAQCQVDERRGRFRFQRAEEPFRKPEAWSDRTYADRRDDIELVIREMLADPEFSPHIDRDRIGCSGHSLGGYTILGLSGGWSSWRDSRIRAALLFSPYAAPYLSHKSISGIHIPVMYQGGTRDLGITPSVRKPGGAYDSSNPPKHFIEFSRVGHLDFTNKACVNFSTVDECAHRSAAARLINNYGIAFLDRYLRQGSSDPLEKRLPGVVDLRWRASPGHPAGPPGRIGPSRVIRGSPLFRAQVAEHRPVLFVRPSHNKTFTSTTRARQPAFAENAYAAPWVAAEAGGSVAAERGRSPPSALQACPFLVFFLSSSAFSRISGPPGLVAGLPHVCSRLCPPGPPLTIRCRQSQPGPLGCEDSRKISPRECWP